MSALQHKGYVVTKLDFNDGERAVIGTITTDAVDRDSEVVMPKGINLVNYRKNPVVLFTHNGQSFPVGKCLWIKESPGGHGLIAKTVFASTPDGQTCHQLFKEGVLNAFSIGFKPDYKSMGPPTEEELKARPYLAACRNMIRKSELLEYSVVTVPANPQALATAVSKGLKMPEWLDTDTPPETKAKMHEEPDGDEGGSDDDGDGDGTASSRADDNRFKADMIEVAERIRHSNKKGIMSCKCYGKAAHWEMHKDDVNDSDDMGYHGPSEIKAMIMAAGAKKAYAHVGAKPEGKGWDIVHPTSLAGKLADVESPSIESDDLDGLTCLKDSLHPEGDFEVVKIFSKDHALWAKAGRGATVSLLLWKAARDGSDRPEVTKWLNDREAVASTITDPLERAKWGLSFDPADIRKIKSAMYAHLTAGALSVDQVVSAKTSVPKGLTPEQIKSITASVVQEVVDQRSGKV